MKNIIENVFKEHMILDFWKKLKGHGYSDIDRAEQKTENIFEKYSPTRTSEVILKGNNVKEDIKKCHEKFCEEYFIFLGDASDIIQKRNNVIYNTLKKLERLGLEKSQNYRDLKEEREKNEKILRNNTHYDLRIRFKKTIENYSSDFYYLSFNDFSKLIETYNYSYPIVFRNFTGEVDEKTIELLELIYNIGSNLVRDEDYYYSCNYNSSVALYCLMKTRRENYSNTESLPIYTGESRTVVEVPNIHSSTEMRDIKLDPPPVVVINQTRRGSDDIGNLIEHINNTIPVFNKSVDYLKDKLKDDWAVRTVRVVDSHRPLIVKKEGLPSILFHIWTEGVLVYGFI